MSVANGDGTYQLADVVVRQQGEVQAFGVTCVGAHPIAHHPLPDSSVVFPAADMHLIPTTMEHWICEHLCHLAEQALQELVGLRPVCAERGRDFVVIIWATGDQVRRATSPRGVCVRW